MGRRLRVVSRSALLERVNESTAGRGHRQVRGVDDGARVDAPPVHLFAGIVVWTQGCAVERDAREESSRAGVAENLRPHGHIGRGAEVTPLGTGSGRRAATELDLAA